MTTSRSNGTPEDPGTKAYKQTARPGRKKVPTSTRANVANPKENATHGSLSREALFQPSQERDARICRWSVSELVP